MSKKASGPHQQQYIAKEKQLKKKLAKEEKERLKRAKENAKKRAAKDRLKEQEQAAKDAAAAEKAAKEPPKPKKRRQFAAGDVFRSRVTAGHRVVEEEKIDLDQECSFPRRTRKTRRLSEEEDANAGRALKFGTNAVGQCVCK